MSSPSVWEAAVSEIEEDEDAVESPLPSTRLAMSFETKDGNGGPPSMSASPTSVSSGKKGDVYIRADGKKVRRVPKHSRVNTESTATTIATTASAGDTASVMSRLTVGSGVSDVYVRADGKKVRRVKKSDRKKTKETEAAADAIVSAVVTSRQLQQQQEEEEDDEEELGSSFSEEPEALLADVLDGDYPYDDEPEPFVEDEDADESEPDLDEILGSPSSNNLTTADSYEDEPKQPGAVSEQLLAASQKAVEALTPQEAGENSDNPWVTIPSFESQSSREKKTLDQIKAERSGLTTAAANPLDNLVREAQKQEAEKKVASPTSQAPARFTSVLSLDVDMPSPAASGNHRYSPMVSPQTSPPKISRSNVSEKLPSSATFPQSPLSSPVTEIPEDPIAALAASADVALEVAGQKQDELATIASEQSERKPGMPKSISVPDVLPTKTASPSGSPSSRMNNVKNQRGSVDRNSSAEGGDKNQPPPVQPNDSESLYNDPSFDESYDAPHQRKKLWQTSSMDDGNSLGPSMPPPPKQTTAAATPGRVSRFPDALRQTTRSQADVLSPNHSAPDAMGQSTSYDQERGGSLSVTPHHMIRTNEDDDAYILNTTLARKRVRVVQLLVFGLLGFLVGFFGSFFVQSSCHFGSSDVVVGANEQIFKLHYGLWKYSPMDSAFQGYSYCMKYDDEYTYDTPIIARTAGVLALLMGSYALTTLWIYLIFGRASQGTWTLSVWMCALAGIFQSLTLLFFSGEVCSRNTCSMGPGALVSVLSAITWFLLSFELYYNMPVSAIFSDIDPGRGGSNLMATLEMSDFQSGAQAYFRRISDKEQLPSLNQKQRKNDSSLGEGMMEISSAKSPMPGSYKAPILV